MVLSKIDISNYNLQLSREELRTIKDMLGLITNSNCLKHKLKASKSSQLYNSLLTQMTNLNKPLVS